MKDVELLASVIAAVGHDVGHPAVTNRFLITSRDPLAIICTPHADNDISVLEMMHTSVTYRVITETGLFSELPQESWDLVRKIVIEMILATDMSRHFDMVGVFRAASITPLELSAFEERLLMFKVVIKCADIGHAAKETSLHEKWTNRIVEEFFAQGDVEKDAKLPVSMYCDRATTNIAKSQVGFLSAIVTPLFEVAAACLKSAQVEECAHQVRSNIDFWQARLLRRCNSQTILNPEPENTVTTGEEDRFLAQRSRTMIECKKAS